MGQFIDYATARKRIGKMALVNMSDLQNLKLHKLDPLENLRNIDHEISASCTEKINTYETGVLLQFLREKPLGVGANLQGEGSGML